MSDSFAPALRLEGITRTYKQATGDLVVFRDVSLSLAPGEIVALAGESGCGKTTLARTVLGLERPSGGEVLYRGEPRTATYTAHVPPETRACMYWLRNRRPEDWREVSERVAAELAQEAAADAALRVQMDEAEERLRRLREQDAERAAASHA